jgi:hypothetical protein
LATSGITSSLLSQIAGSSSTANQFVTDLNQLAQDLQGGNLSAAQEDFVTLSADAQDGATASTATSSASGITTSLLSDIAASSSSETTFVSDLNQLGTDLQNGDLTAAQDDMLALDSSALNAASAAGASSAGSSSATTKASATEQTELIVAIVEAMSDGDNSAVSSGLSELASVSSNAQGATILEEESTSYGSSAGASTASASISQLLQSLDAGGSDGSTSSLSLLA